MGSPIEVQGFLGRIDQSGDCWTWPGAWHANGYPLVRFQGRQWMVHRLAFTLLVGPLKQGQQLDKTCGGAGCVRPGDGHWELRRPRHLRTVGQLPRGISHEGTDKQGTDVWRVSVYVGRDRRGKRVELRARVHGTADDAVARRDELLARRGEEQKKLAAGVYRKTMAELLDRYFPVWQKTPRKGHLPAKITVYHRELLIESLIKPALGHRVPAQMLPGEIAEWYDDLAEHGYVTYITVRELLVTGRCRQCGTCVETVADKHRRTARVACSSPGCDTEVLCRSTGQYRTRTKPKQHPPAVASTLEDIHAVLRGAFRFGVQRGWLAMAENPMLFVERRTGVHTKQRPPSAAEVRRALRAAEDHPDPNLHPLLACLGDTGARLGEPLALRESDLDVERCAVRIEESVTEPPKAFGGRQVKDTKTHARRTVAVHQETIRILLRHLERCRVLAAEAGVEMPEDPFVFPRFAGRRMVITPGEPASPTRMSKTISKHFASLGIQASAKSLRAFVVTSWRKARVPDDVLRGRVGHEDATPVTDRHYNYREEVADRHEADTLVSELLYDQQGHPGQPPRGSADVISLQAIRARREQQRRSGQDHSRNS